MPRIQPLILILIALLFVCSTETPAQRKPAKPRPKPTTPAQPANPEPATPPTPPPPPEPVLLKQPDPPLTVEEMERKQAVIETSMGNITIEFYPKSAPNHVRQFIWLAENNFFDGMTFSRVLPKFIIQSGNQASWKEDNPNQKKRFDVQKLKAEYDTNLKHERGTVSMARPNGEPDAGTHHFFICALKATSLDGSYSIFAHVVNGYEVLDAIAAVPLEEGTPDKPRDRIEVKIVIKEKPAPEAKPTEAKPAETPK